MASIDIYNNVNPIKVIPISTYASDGEIQSDTINMSGYESIVFCIFTGNNSGADGDYSFLLLEADPLEDGTPGLFEPVDELFIQGAYPLAISGLTAGNRNAIFKFGYVGNKQFLKITMDVDNTTDGLTLGVFAIEGAPRHAPTPELPTPVPIPV